MKKERLLIYDESELEYDPATGEIFSDPKILYSTTRVNAHKNHLLHMGVLVIPEHQGRYAMKVRGDGKSYPGYLDFLAEHPIDEEDPWSAAVRGLSEETGHTKGALGQMVMMRINDGSSENLIVPVFHFNSHERYDDWKFFLSGEIDEMITAGVDITPWTTQAFKLAMMKGLL